MISSCGESAPVGRSDDGGGVVDAALGRLSAVSVDAVGLLGAVVLLVLVVGVVQVLALYWC